jgi:hypothetical protein
MSRGQVSTFNKRKIGFAEPMLPQRRQKAAARDNCGLFLGGTIDKTLLVVQETERFLRRQ